MEGVGGAVEAAAVAGLVAGELEEGRDFEGAAPGVGDVWAEDRFEDLVFDAADSQHAPAGYSHAVDEVEFDGVAWMEGVDEAFEEVVEVGLGFGFQDETGGVEAVLAGIAGRAEFAFGSFGTFGEGSVGA